MKILDKRMPLSARRASYEVAAIYVVAAGMWILFSDQILLWYFEDPSMLTRVQTIKGWFFVFATAVMLTWLVRRYARKSYRESELLENIISNIPLYVFWKGRDNRYLGCNQRFASVAGVGKRENIVGKTDDDLAWRREEAEFIERSDRKIMEKREPLLDVEEIKRQLDGKDAAFLTSKVPLEDESGNVIGMLGICSDITLRKRDEEALRESRDRAQAIIATALDAVVEMNDKEVIISWNPQAEEVFGWPVEEAMGKSMSATIVPPQHREAHEKGLKHFLATGQGPTLNKRIEITALHRDGHEFPVELTVTPIRLGNTYTFTAFVRDITERKQAEVALKESEERFRSVFEAAAAGMTTFSPTGRFWQVNPAICRFLGYTEDELLKLGIEEVTHPEDLKRTRHLYEEIMMGRRQAFDDEKRYLRKDGSMVWGHATVAGVLDAAGKPIYYVGLVQDITDRRRAAEALRESERKLSTLMGNLPGMAYRCRNDRDWTMEFVSEGCSALTGYSPGDLIDNRTVPYAEIIHPEDRDGVWQKVQAALEERKPFRVEYRVRTSSGEERWLWEQGEGIFTEESGLVALEGFITDITERKRAEETLCESD